MPSVPKQTDGHCDESDEWDTLTGKVKAPKDHSPRARTDNRRKRLFFIAVSSVSAN
jgi:hypothetical protein